MACLERKYTMPRTNEASGLGKISLKFSSPIENPNLAELIKIIDHKDSRAKKVSRSINSDRRRLEFQPDAEELEILQKVLKESNSISMQLLTKDFSRL